ncbi:hypothetical protein BBK82_18210 [Lentzea guizhouensis]|uniref:Uncharacterized protein n=1 Tax=Lentzea guizhouensis TaxID=1586287 RepID=A0A1B2HJ35_9PSEU|nr:hypothetical protein [Lentzea guizhouensis]ANZ37702.1 hypothetical protein BBK82_18210 [Lentzea guizhouensis]
MALGAKASAEMTQQEAEASVREANQAVFQSVVADRAASAAAASATLVIDASRAVDAILKPYAALNADARRALQVVADALLISEEQSRLAREKAAEAAEAAVRASKAADDAVADVKPAYEAAARAAESANQAAQYAQVANDAANQAVQHAQGAHAAAGTAGRWSNNAQQDAVAAGNAAAAASASAASADRAAAATEQIYTMARANADKVQQFIQSVADRIQDVHEYRVRLDRAEQIARDEAARKAAELNLELARGILTIDRCLDNPVFNFEDCKRAANKVEEVTKNGLRAYTEAAADSMLTGARCAAGDQAACQLMREGKDKLSLLYKQIGEGIVEGAKGTLDGLLTGLDCVGGSVFGDFHSCKQIWDGLVYTVQNPYTLIHLDVWHENPAKALGLTLWDLSFGAVGAVASGGGATVTRTLGLMKNALAKGTGKVLDNIADLRSFLVKLQDTVPDRLPGSLGEILSAKVRVEGNVGKIDNAVAVVDGRLYRMESYSRQLEGDLANLDGAIVRVEGGTLRIENGMAKLDGAKLKVERGTPCVSGLMAAAADPGCGYQNPTIENGQYRHDIGALKIRIDADDHSWGLAHLDEMRAAEKLITPDIDDVADIARAERPGRNPLPGDERLEVKGDKSFFRKLFEEMWEGGSKKSPADVRLKLNDTVRYTYVLSPEKYSVGLYDVIDALTKKGYQLAGAKNFWHRSLTPKYDKYGNRLSNYPGINLTFWTKDKKQLFEVQIHTEESFKAKKKEEPHYNNRRANRAAINAIKNKAISEGRNPDRGELFPWEQEEIKRIEADDVFENSKSSEIFDPITPPPGAVHFPELKLG